ncbi:MAG: dihydrolipoyl dehydrogenase [Myxococcales bacterium]|nr:dihydrolipoyl dehydrogenase [Myxococcales bacterium]
MTLRQAQGGSGDKYDLAVIGSGPGGYVAAIRGAQLGMKVAVIERAELGGICGNWGCIPTKALLRSAEVLDQLHHLDELGLRADNIGFDFARVIARSRAVAAQQAKGIAFLFKKNKIDHLAGTARLAPPRTLLVDGKEVAAKRVVIATGARPKGLPGISHDGDRVLSYREAMILPERPASLVIIGAGAIGVEFAYFYAALGTKVVIVEALPRLLPVEDEEVSEALTRSFVKRGIEVITGFGVERIDTSPSGVEVIIARQGADRRTLAADRALLAVGVRGNVEDLGLEAIGVKLERGFIVADRTHYRTSVDGIHAIGDVIGPPLLAHKASAEAIACVERIAGVKDVHAVDYTTIPGCTYCRPEVASVGLTERQARESGREVKVGRFPWRASGKARTAGETEGFVKVILDAKHGELLGAHLIGGAATELIGELGLARSGELTADEILGTVHAHPTFAEAIKSAVEDAYGEAIDQ